ncbi:MAG: hypothetical protein ABI120_13895 [Gemmatimonadaceae bacterium]
MPEFFQFLNSAILVVLVGLVGLVVLGLPGATCVVMAAANFRFWPVVWMGVAADR